VNPALAVLAVAVVVGGVIAVSTRDARVGAIRVLAGDLAPGVDGPAAVLVEVGPREAVAAACALGALAVAPVLIGRDTFRLGVGLLLAVLAADLLRVGLSGSPSAFGQVVTAGLLVALAAASAMVARRAMLVGGTLELPTERRAAAGPAAERTEPAAGPSDLVTPRSGVGRRSVPGR
jgi:hypothetical protein